MIDQSPKIKEALSKPTGFMILRVNLNVNYRPCNNVNDMLMQVHLLKQIHHLVGDSIMGRIYSCLGVANMWKISYITLNFSVNVKLLLKV